MSAAVTSEEPVADDQPLLQVRGLYKQFGGAQALSDVSFDVAPGEIRGLVGENGSGKSTAIRIISGVLAGDAGDVRVAGRLLRPADAADRIEARVGVAAQEPQLCADLTVAENIFLGQPCGPRPLVSRRQMVNEAREVLDRAGLSLDPTKTVRQLSQDDQHLCEVARVLACDAQVVAYDETTASLTLDAVAILLRIIRMQAERGASVLFISHRLDEVMNICDSITVLRDGELVGTVRTSEVTEREIIRMMVGREVAAQYERDSLTPGAAVFRAEQVCGGTITEPIDLEVRAGEVVGIGGLAGSGRSTLLRLLFGAQHRRGRVLVNGKPVRGTAFASISSGIGYVPEDRRRSGLALAQSVRANVSLLQLGKQSWWRPTRKPAELQLVDDLVEKLRLKTRSAASPVKTLSGGNQQKIVIGRWLQLPLAVWLLDEPTRGVDIGTKHEIYDLIHELAEAGAAILIVSSDLVELIGISDRIHVMREGRITATYDRGVTADEIGDAMAATSHQTHLEDLVPQR